MPVLHASVGGFSRLWLGSLSANALAVTGEIHREQGLFDELEQTLSLPLTAKGWLGILTQETSTKTILL